MTALASIFSELQPDASTVVAGATITSTRRVGIELELENIVHDHQSRWWNFIHDDSLRNNGREFVFKHPLAGVDVEKAIRALPGILREEEPELSERTSTHIHVDVRDLTLEQLGNLVVLFAACETYVYTLGGKHRYNNIYCPGFTASQELIERAINLLNAGNSRTAAHRIVEWCKYSGINLEPVSRYGSVEFRMFQGYQSAHVLMQWVKCVTRLVDFAASITRAELKDLVEGDVVSAVFSGTSMVDEAITKRNKLNALAILYGAQLRSIRLRSTTPEEATVLPTTDRQSVLAQLAALAGQ